MMTDPPDGPRDGITFEADRDEARLNRQGRRVWRVLRQGGWYSLAEISTATGDPESSVSARLRDFRKDRFGAHTVDRRRRSGGLWEFRLVPNPDPPPVPETAPRDTRSARDVIAEAITSALPGGYGHLRREDALVVADAVIIALMGGRDG